MTSFLRRHARGIWLGVVHLWWVFVIVMPLCGLVLWIAIDYSTAQTERKFNQLLRISDDKHQQSLHSQAVLFAYSINKSACGLRGFAKPQLRRALERRKDYPNETPAQRALNENAIKTTRAFLDTQVTVPAGFDCKTLPKRPPKAAP